jgi:hypothetical protein
MLDSQQSTLRYRHRKIISRALIPDGMRPSTLPLASVRNEIRRVTIQTFSVFDSTINRVNSPRQGNAILR